MQTADPVSRPLNGVDTGVDRLAPPAPETLKVRSNLRPNATPPTVAHSPARRRKFTVTFYSQQSEPNSLPTFPYAVVGTVLGHTKFLAYVEADDPQHAAYGISAFFDVAQVDSVDDGHKHIDTAPLRGTIAATQPRGFFSRLFGVSGG